MVIAAVAAFLICCCLPTFIVPVFQFCCRVMEQAGKVLGLTYKEVCVIGNIYVQGLLWAVSSALPLVAAIKAVRERRSLSRIMAVMVSAAYTMICLLIFAGFAWHYRPPLVSAFDLCVADLHNVTRMLGATYEVVNIIFFVVFWGLAIIVNYILFRIIIFMSRNSDNRF